MGRLRRKEMLSTDRTDRTDLSLIRQCKLLKIGRSSLYYAPVGFDAKTLSRLVLAGQRLARMIPLFPLIWRTGYGGQITIAGNGFGKIGS